MKRGLIFAGILVGVGTLAWWIYNQANLLMDYCFNFDGYQILNLTRDQITIEVRLAIKNKSSVPVEVNGYDLSAYINGAYATKVRSSKPHRIEAKSFSVLSILIDVEPKKNKAMLDWKFLSRILFDVKNTNIRIAGSLTATALGLKAENVPVDVSMKLKDMLPDKSKPSQPCL